MNFGLGRAPKSNLTLLIIAVNILVYAYTAILSGNFIGMNTEVIVTFGQYNRAVLQYGWYWQLFTAMFVHLNIVHIAGNMFFLLIFGFRAEEVFSPWEYLLIYLASGLAGDLLTLLLPLNYISAGASGAIFGIFGGVTIFLRRSIGQSIMGALIYAFFLLLLSSGLQVNIAAHFGGLIVGLMLGYLLAESRRRRIVYQYRYTYGT